MYLIIRFIAKRWYALVVFGLTLYNPIIKLLGYGIFERICAAFIFSFFATAIDELAYEYARQSYYSTRATGLFHSAINSWNHYAARGKYSMVLFGGLNFICYVIYGIILSCNWLVSLFQ
ncbi:MAG: hypothetical protein KQ78_00829 [Candidatus Izimaplasma bacterium HR2]|nr:MAG: hypothetical protein KQ78_00829 [Candidatus Izimaplasma bacterium HR2]